MKIRIIAFTKQGVEMGAFILRGLTQDKTNEVEASTLKKYCGTSSFMPLRNGLMVWTKEGFEVSEALVFIGATGIAVRAIAPFVKDKYTDPAVLVVDEKGHYVIPLLSGHIGGANRLARKIASLTNGVPVVSTATDLNSLFAVDEWAYQKGFKVPDREGAKQFAARLLGGEAIQVKTPFAIVGDLPKQLFKGEESGYSLEITTTQRGGENLQVIPPIMTVGIGCRRGTTREKIEKFLLEILEKAALCVEAIGSVATIDLKKDEKGLLELVHKYHWPIAFYTSEELNQVEGSFSYSAFVKHITDVDNVCERAAVAKSKGQLVVHKQSRDGVTIAIAQAPLVLDFND